MEEKELVIVQDPKSAVEIQTQVNLIQKVMKQVMKDKVHYGTIPGCGPKPTLLKPGAEKIMMTFRLAADPIVEDISTKDEARYRVTVRLLTSNGDFVGAGIGECSSNEEKYKWRKIICNEEFEETPEDKRREKWQKGYGGEKPFKVKQIRTNIADIANTILKMSKKRALIDAVLTATAASDIFTQDIEDIPAEILNNGKQRVESEPIENIEYITNKEQHQIADMLAAKNIPVKQLLELMKVNSLNKIPRSKFNYVTVKINNRKE